MINCVIVDGDKTARKSVEVILEQVKHLTVVKACNTLADASDVFLKQPVHILFLDIEQSGQDGLGVLNVLKFGKPKIIVTSALREVATDAFDIDAIDFILKPISVPKVVKSIAKAIRMESYDHKDSSLGESSIFLKVEHKFVKVDLKDVFLVEALSDYVNVHTAAKRYTVHGTMKSMEDRLPEKDFIRVHKSYIVRIDHIVEVERETLSIEKRTIPVGNTYRKELMERLKII